MKRCDAARPQSNRERHPRPRYANNTTDFDGAPDNWPTAPMCTVTESSRQNIVIFGARCVSLGFNVENENELGVEVADVGGRR